ncbi:MAG TPA: DUF488 family protein [Methanobacterium sp.]|nr:DUF488 family protein [Methanobacterium sp.]
MIKIKRITELPEKEDGIRIMVESKCLEEIDFKDVEVDLWLKEIAPSPECYECLEEGASAFDKFKEKYRDKLRSKKTLIKIIRDLENKNGTVTLLYCSADNEKNCAAILKEKLEGYMTINRSIGRIHGG